MREQRLFNIPFARERGDGLLCIPLFRPVSLRLCHLRLIVLFHTQQAGDQTFPVRPKNLTAEVVCAAANATKSLQAKIVDEPRPREALACRCDRLIVYLDISQNDTEAVAAEHPQPQGLVDVREVADPDRWICLLIHGPGNILRFPTPEGHPLHVKTPQTISTTRTGNSKLCREAIHQYIPALLRHAYPLCLQSQHCLDYTEHCVPAH